VTIRKAAPQDEKRWGELFDGYCRFYEREPSAELNRHTWARIMDEASPIHAIVAESGGRVVGIANYVVHEHTLHLTPACYLADLFVDPAQRGGGTGRALIEAMYDKAETAGASRAHWLTQTSNAQARIPHDQLADDTGSMQKGSAHV